MGTAGGPRRARQARLVRLIRVPADPGSGGLPAHRLWVGGPVPKGAAAITLGSLVAVRRGHERSERLLRHEAEHVAQYGRHGIAGFLVRYLRAYLRWRLRGYGHWAAYRRIPFEASAEWRARRALGVGVIPEPTRPPSA